MISINIITGLLFILLGFLVKKFPDLIAGYNTMPSEEKKKVDIKGLSNHMRLSLIMIGSSLILIDFLCLLPVFELEIYGVGIFIAVVLIGTLFMWVRAQTFTNKAG